MLYIIKNDYFLTHYILDQLACRADVCLIEFVRAPDHKKLSNKVLRYIDLKTKRKKITKDILTRSL